MKTETQDCYNERLLRVLVYIQEHLDEALRLEELADVAHFSPYHFHRIFRGMIGESVHGHVRRLRLERAAHRLRFTDQPVTGIAFEAGYETHEAFTRAFRTMFDNSPTGFRKARRATPVKSVPSPGTLGRTTNWVIHTRVCSVSGFLPAAENRDPPRRWSSTATHPPIPSPKSWLRISTSRWRKSHE